MGYKVNNLKLEILVSAFWILTCSASLFNNFLSTNCRKVSFGYCVWHMIFSHDIQFSSVQLLDRVQLFVSDPMNHMPGLPAHYQLLEFTQTHVHWVGDAILCCPLLLLPSIYPSIRVFSNESALHIKWPKYQLFKWVGSSHQVAEVSASTSVLPMNTQDWSPLKWTGWISLQSKGLSRVLSNTTAQKH